MRRRAKRVGSSDWSGVRLAIAALVVTISGGTAGYLAFGFGLHDAVYQTVITVTTVGFQEVQPLNRDQRTFTMVLAVAGTATTLYTFGAVLETVLEGRLRDLYGRRRMQRRIDELSDHVIVCGWGRVGRALAKMVAGSGTSLVVIDIDPERLGTASGIGPGGFVVLGDATEDSVLQQAGVERARALVGALDNDAANLLVTLSARALNPQLFIAARARLESNEEKLRRAGADRVVNPQAIGGSRLAAFVLQPNVAEFLDVVMHDGSLEFRLGEVTVAANAPAAGQPLSSIQRETQRGALVLAVRNPDSTFVTNPPHDLVLAPGQVLIAIGTASQLGALGELCRR
ncbi:MAG: potassium channel family protein [Acidimicrobiales bacterium]